MLLIVSRLYYSRSKFYGMIKNKNKNTKVPMISYSILILCKMKILYMIIP